MTQLDIINNARQKAGMPLTEAYNIDCMEYMRSLPDNSFDIAVVDPPYGDGQEKAQFREQGVHFNGRGRTAKYSHSVHVERESPRSTTVSVAGLRNTKVIRTGCGYAEKYGKKSSRGMLPRRRSISQSFSASHAIK